MRLTRPGIAVGVIRVARQYREAHPTLVEDLVQQTYLKICSSDHAVLRKFLDKPPLELPRYLRVMAANLARDHFSSRFSDRQAVALEDLPESLFAAPAQASEMMALAAQIDQILKSGESENAERDRIVFWLYYRTGLTAKAIAAIPAIGLSVKGVESVVYRATQLVREALARPKGFAAEESSLDGGCR